MQHINVLKHVKKITLQAKSYHEILFGSDDYYTIGKILQNLAYHKKTSGNQYQIILFSFRLCDT
jgi:hypothetical protein